MDSAVTITPTIVGVPSWEARNAWPLALPLIGKAIDLTDGAFEASDVLQAIEAQEAQLWIAYTDAAVLGAVVSKIIVFPRKRTLYCPFVGGEIGRLKEWWEPMFAKLEEFARAKGCDWIEGSVRDGWARVLPGMKRIGSMLRKDLQS